MTDLLTVNYARTGKSTNSNKLGMREMQARAFAQRDKQYLLIKAPPASGKSRALMFIALDKLINQGIKKVIVTVPEKTIGGSFKNTNLKSTGFFANWTIADEYNLCTAGREGKIDKLIKFLNDDKERILLCTHATFKLAFDKIKFPYKFNDTLIAIDEFHHASAAETNILGSVVHKLMAQSTAHIVAMTGSYFRGDAIQILDDKDEEQFTQVTYTYYEQLNGYKYLKSLGLGYHFYQGRYYDALEQVLDLSKKTIIHIPNVQSIESTGDKLTEVERIMDMIGCVEYRNESSGIYTVKSENGETLKVADLVTDDDYREKSLTYLRNITNRDDMDIIIALGMAKEGFDWPWCEHVLTIGYRSSLTEIVQIIGRATRDCEGKTHAQFTNLIAQPDATDTDLTNSVNNMLKAITVSLLMEQILAPNINFKPRSLIHNGEEIAPGTVIYDDLSIHKVSKEASNILSNGGLENITIDIIQDINTVGRIITKAITDKEFTEIELPLLVQKKFPKLIDDDVRTVSKFVELFMKANSAGGHLSPNGELIDREGRIIIETPKADGTLEKTIVSTASEGEISYTSSLSQDVNSQLQEKDHLTAQSFPHKHAILNVSERFINIENLNIDLIEKINPFQGAFEVLSKSVTAPMLKTIQSIVKSKQSSITESEAMLLWPTIKEFNEKNNRFPSSDSYDPYEQRLGKVLDYLKIKVAEHKARTQNNPESHC